MISVDIFVVEINKHVEITYLSGFNKIRERKTVRICAEGLLGRSGFLCDFFTQSKLWLCGKLYID